MMTRLQGFCDSGAWPVLSLGLITKVAQKVLPRPWAQNTASESKSEQPNVAKSLAWHRGGNWQQQQYELRHLIFVAIYK